MYVYIYAGLNVSQHTCAGSRTSFGSPSRMGVLGIELSGLRVSAFTLWAFCLALPLNL